MRLLAIEIDSKLLKYSNGLGWKFLIALSSRLSEITFESPAILHKNDNLLLRNRRFVIDFFNNTHLYQLLTHFGNKRIEMLLKKAL